MIILCQRFVQQLTESQRVCQFTDIDKRNKLCTRQLQTVDITAVKTNKKTDFDKADQRQYDRSDRTDQKVVKRILSTRNQAPLIRR